MGKKTDLTEPNPTDIQWTDNHERIVDAWESILSLTGKRPTITAIAKITGFARMTITNHIARMKFDRDITPKHLLNLDTALDKLYTLGVDGNDVKALVEYIKLVGNPSAKKEISQNITNKTLRVTFTGKNKEDMIKTETVEFEEIETDEKD